MKSFISIFDGVVLAVTLGSPAFAHPGKGGVGGGGGESQKAQISGDFWDYHGLYSACYQYKHRFIGYCLNFNSGRT